MMFLLILIGGTFVFLGIGSLGSYYARRTSVMSKMDRRELIRLRKLVEDLDRLAYENREIDPITAPAVLDLIKQNKWRELE